MKKPSCHDELTIRHRFDRLCQMSLKGEAINYYGTWITAGSMKPCFLNCLKRS